MSTTVNYKGNTIATLSNETKTLTTAGTWVEGDISITDALSMSIILFENLHDSTEDVANTYIAGSTETAYNGWTSTGYISVKPNTYYRVKNTPGNVYNAFYKADKSSEKNSVQVPYSGDNSNTYVFIKTTSNTAYIRMSGASSGVANYEIYEVKTGFPTGTLNITSNGNYSVSEYDTANININSSPTLQSKTDIAPTTSSQTITADSGYDGLSSVQINAMPSGTASTPATTITANPSISINSSGLIAATASASQDVTPSVSAGYVSSGTKGTITVSGSKTQQLTTQAAKTVTPTESEQTAVAANVYTTGIVKVGAISSTYVGSGITQRSSTDLTISGATITTPAGYYEESASKSVASGTAGTPIATKGTVSNHQVSITPSVTNTTGYITGGTKNGTAVTVTASELASGNKEITSNGTNIDIVGYSTVSVAVPADEPNLQAKTGIAPTTSSQTITADSGYDGLSSVQINAMPTMTLPTSASSTSSGTSKATIGRSTSAQYINIPTGYNGTASYYTISATPNGTATAPSSISGTSATVSTGTNTLTLTKTISVTPTISTAGYISAGTAGNSSVSLTASVTTKGATTYNTSTTDQTIASGTYLTGTQTIKGVTVSGLDASKILSGTTVMIGDANDADRIMSVLGTVTFSTIRTGISAPSSSLGENGDIYVQS